MTTVEHNMTTTTTPTETPTYTIEHADGRLLASGLSPAGVDDWWKRDDNSDRYFGDCVVGDRIMVSDAAGLA